MPVKPLDLTAPTDAGADGIPDAGSTHKTVIAYDDENQQIADVAYSVTYLGDNDSDTLLEVGEKAELTVEVGTAITINTGTDLQKNTTFALCSAALSCQTARNGKLAYGERC